MARFGGQNWPAHAFTRGGKSQRPASPSLPANAQVRSLAPPLGGEEQEGRVRLASPLLTDFPQYVTLTAYASEIMVPSSVSIATGDAGWYSIRKIRVPDDLPECAYVGADVELLPADVDGAATPSAGSAAAWGDLNGIASQIVLEVNAPLQPRTWTSRPAYLPGLDTASPNLHVPDGAAEYLSSLSFPPGKLSATTISKLYSQPRFLPALRRLSRGDSLDVCLVVRRSQVNAAVNKRFCGYIKTRLIFLPIAGGNTWAKTS